MSAKTCQFEPTVAAAARSGQWSKDLRTHVSGCVDCGDAARVAAWMGDVATRLARTQTLPDPTYLWLRAEIERRTREANAVSRLRVSLLALLSLTVGLIVAAAVLAVLPQASVTVSDAMTWLRSAPAGAAPDYVALIGTVWLGFPLLLAATYLLVFRPAR
jgi:hypothetical protein